MKSGSIAVLALAAAACSPKPAPAPAKADAPTAAATPDAAPAAKLAVLPDCSKVEAKDNGDSGWAHPDCRLNEEKSGLVFTVRYGAPVAGKDGDKQTPVSVMISTAGDAPMQTINEKMDSTFNPPSLADIDGDGFSELLIPLETGNVNTNFAIWYSPPAANQFVRLGEVSAVSFGKTADGLITASSRSSANSWSIEYLLLQNAQLTPLVTVDVAAEGDPDHITGIRCELLDDSGIKALKLNAKAAKAKFCGDPAAKDAFK